MPGGALQDPIQQLDVAVVDADLLWRVEMMNAVRPLYADEFADVVTVAERVHPDDVTVLILGPHLPDTTAAALVELQADHPNLAVLAMAGEAGLAEEQVDVLAPGDATQEVLVATARDLLTDLRAEHVGPVPEEDPETRQRLAEALDRARLVVITSAKGGEGASMVAANLATALADAPAGRVAVIDTDPVFGDVGLMFDVPVDARGVDGDDVSDPEVVAGLTTCDAETGLDIVLPPRPVDPLAVLTGDALLALVGTVALDHDIVIVEAAPSLVADAGLAATADLVLIVASPRLSGLKNAAILTPTLLQLTGHRPDVVEVVLNHADRHERETSRIAEALHAPVVATIPSDRGLGDGVDRHVPGVLCHPHSAGAKAIRRLGEHVVQRLGPLAPPVPDAGIDLDAGVDLDVDAG